MTDTVALEPGKVEEIFLDCLFKEGEDTSNHVPAEGITMMVGFHPERLESHREEIKALLAELPDEFKSSERGGGGGWSFLNACMDRHGQQWTGLHKIMEQLVTLGVALGLVDYTLPRDMWGVMPGGVPYFVVK